MKHTLKGSMFTEIVLEVFKLSGFLIAEGDKITEAHGLSSARWKILGSLSLSGSPLSRYLWRLFFPIEVAIEILEPRIAGNCRNDPAWTEL